MKKMLAWALLNFALFFVLAPGNFVTLPQGGNKFAVSATHAALFVVANVVLARVLHKSL
jgi:hypothetical protein